MSQNRPATYVVTGTGRLSYPHLFEKYSGEEGKEAKYSVCFLFPKTDTLTKKKLDAAAEAAKEAGKAAKSTGWGGKIPAKLKMPIRDGDDPAEEKGPEFEGHWFFNCSSNQRPQIVDASRNEILDKDEIYPGCHARIAVNLFGFGGKGTNGVGVGLNNVQKVKDGERLGGGGFSAEADFADDFVETEIGDDDDDLLG